MDAVIDVIDAPRCIRLALWATAVSAGHLEAPDSMDEAVAEITDADATYGDLRTLGDWCEAGERLIIPALPRPGQITGMPLAPAEAHAAASLAGECLMAATQGGILVPTVTSYGPVGDEGVMVTWTAYPSEPVAPHRLSMLDLNSCQRALRHAMVSARTELEELAAYPWDLIDRPGQPHLDVPGPVDREIHAVIDQAFAVVSMATAGLQLLTEAPGPADLHSHLTRERTLRTLRDEAREALAQATTLACRWLANASR